MDQDLLLSVKDLTTEFKTEEETVIAVNGLSFTLKKGETLGIVGESGSGKSVTALSLMQLVPGPAGRIVKGEAHLHPSGPSSTDLLQVPEKQMRHYRGNELAMIFQEPMTSLNPVLTCGAQVVEAIRQHKKVSSKEARQLTLQLFEEVMLPEPERIYKSFPHQLSGGQKQRVMIAMAISCEPSILIADEPTTALDVTVQKHILELLDRLQAKHRMGIVFISHDLAVIAELADRVFVMYRGKVVEEGPVKEIFSNPQHAYTKGLMACRPTLEKRLNFLPTISNFMRIEDETVQKHSLTIREIMNTLEVTPEERKAQHEKLYAQEPLLKVEGLKTWFPVRRGVLGRPTKFVKAVDDVSFEVYPGETLGLVGESGCGKTTLGRSVLRLIEPTAGQVIYNGANLNKLSNSALRKLRKDIQIIFQDPYSSLNPRMTVGAAIMEPMKVHGIVNGAKDRKRKAIELLERVSLKEKHLYRYPHEFSGGQRQRICIARSLATKPRFVICDESVSALDVSVQAKVLNLLNELKTEFGLTYIFISHDLSVVKFMSDRMMVMNQGKMVELGEADEVYSNPQSEYSKKLIEAVPGGTLEDIDAAITRRANRRSSSITNG